MKLIPPAPYSVDSDHQPFVDAPVLASPAPTSLPTGAAVPGWE